MRLGSCKKFSTRHVLVPHFASVRQRHALRFGDGHGANAVTGMSLSPSMDMLATTHEGKRGVYLWANSAMYAPAGTADGKTDDVVSDGNADSGDDDVHASSEEPTVLVRLPTLHAESADAEDIELGSAPKSSPRGLAPG